MKGMQVAARLFTGRSIYLVHDQSHVVAIPIGVVGEPFRWCLRGEGHFLFTNCAIARSFRPSVDNSWKLCWLIQKDDRVRFWDGIPLDSVRVVERDHDHADFGLRARAYPNHATSGG